MKRVLGTDILRLLLKEPLSQYHRATVKIIMDRHLTMFLGIVACALLASFPSWIVESFLH
jgi:hypothetical protein